MTDVEQIKAKIDIVEFISEYIQLKKMGRNFKALCPFHPEKTPSFIVSPERGSWHCFGACNMGGDIVSFLEKWENIEFWESLKILAKRGGVTLSRYEPTETSKLKEKLYEVNHLAAEFYHFLLTSHRIGKRAKEYLVSRHIKDETVATFMLGYAPESWDSLSAYLSKKGYSQDDIYTAGLVVKSEGGRFYDRFRGRLMFALEDQRGNVIGFSGRLLDEKDYPERERGAKYINTAETPIYSKGNNLYGLHATREAIKKEDKAVVVEGEFDLLSSFQAGVANVVAIKGSALTDGQLLLIKRYTQNITLALDSDFAGSQAARRGIEIAEGMGFNIAVVSLPVGKDPAECIEKGAHLWKKAVESASSIYDFVINLACGKYDKNEAIGKKKIGEEVIPFLGKIVNPIVQSHYIKYLANLLTVSEESIAAAIRTVAKKEAVAVVLPTTPVTTPREEMLEEYLLSLIVQNPDPSEVFAGVMNKIVLDDFYVSPVRKIVEQLILYFKKHKKLNVSVFTQVLTSEIIPTFDRAFMQDIAGILANSQTLQRELDFTAKEVKKAALRRTINNLSTKIRQLEDKGQEIEVKKASEQIRQAISSMRALEKDGASS